MSDRNLNAQKMLVLQQRLHREELKLARLRTKANAARQSDARVKLRLGGLLFLMNWQDLSEDKLEELVVEVKAAVDNTNDREMHRISGENRLKMLEQRKIEGRPEAMLEEDQRRKINHQKITIGGMMVKHDLDQYPKSVVLGALLKINDSQVL